ncbi:MAG: MBL fold metallo-hydrolase [Bacteroidales bacterium]|nr:MBL fold metallo-hydrolase [Bacteroidales bacterium]
MKITILSDNHAGSFLKAEHGLSYLIEHKGQKILFDTGQSDLFLKNAAHLNIDIEDIETVVLSHGHYDHGNGLIYATGKKLICHPGCFVKRYRKTDKGYIGLNRTREQLSCMFSLITTVEPLPITDSVIFLGQIPRVTDFESVNTPFVFENDLPDFVDDDSALAVVLPIGIYVITGCGHSGIVNTLEYAKNVTGVNKICGISGGFHLKENDLQTRETVRYIKQNNISYLFPSHCTGLPALCAFHNEFGISLARTGDTMSIR